MTDTAADSRTDGPTYTACTVTSPDFLPHARVMTDSVDEHDPGAHIVVLVLGDEDQIAGAGFDERVEVLRLTDLVDEVEAARLGLMYSTQGLAGSMKPRLLRHLLERDGGPVILIDSDICLYGSLGEVAAKAAAGPALLTTHAISPLPESDLPMLKAGVFNSGFVAVGAQAAPLLDWWCERTRRDCVYMPWEGMLWEQSWLGLAPAFFEVQVPRDPGVNVLGREMLDADIEWDGEHPRIGGAPLRCFHFSGPYDPHDPGYILAPSPPGHPAISHRSMGGMEVPWLSLEDKPGALRLSRDYADRLIEAGFDEPRGDAIYSTLEGNPIHRGIRRAYRAGVIEAEDPGQPEPPNPFAGAQIGELHAWLAEAPSEAAQAQGLNRFLLAVWESFFGATSVFPKVPGPDTPAYLDWLSERLPRDRVYVPDSLLPPGVRSPGNGAQRPARGSAVLRAATSLARRARRDDAGE